MCVWGGGADATRLRPHVDHPDVHRRKVWAAVQTRLGRKAAQEGKRGAPFMSFYCTDQQIFNMNYSGVEFCRLCYTFIFVSPCCVAGRDYNRLSRVSVDVLAERGHRTEATHSRWRFTSSPAGSRLHPPSRGPCLLFVDCV